jgi:hypothetical protein
MNPGQTKEERGKTSRPRATPGFHRGFQYIEAATTERKSPEQISL